MNLLRKKSTDMFLLQILELLFLNIEILFTYEMYIIVMFVITKYEERLFFIDFQSTYFKI